MIGWKCRYACKVWLKLLSQQTKLSDCMEQARSVGREMRHCHKRQYT